jgi:type I restriction enzyme S subunit
MIDGFQKIDIGYFPKDWGFGRIDNYFEVQQGKSVSKANRIGNNQKPFLRTSNLLWGKITLDELDYLHFSKEEERKYKLKDNDLLVCEGGDIGRTAIWKNELSGCYYQNHLHRLRAINPNIIPEFVLFWMQYAFLYAKLYYGRANITTIPNLSKSRLSEFIIPVPSLPEQRKIAHILNTVQRAIEQQNKLIRTTTELKKALMQKLFTEGINGEKQKQTEMGLVPESWEVMKINDMYDFTNKPRNLSVNFPVAFIPMELVPLDDIYIRTYEFRDTVSSGTYVENGDLLLAKITPSFENGKQGFVDIDKLYAYATTEVIPIRNKESVNNLFYLFYYLLKDDIRKQLADKMEGSTGRQRLSKNILAETLIPKPSINEQKQIANVFSSIDKKVSFHYKKKQSLTSLFKTLLYELMTGQRRVNEIDFEKAVKLYEIPVLPLDMVAEETVEYVKTRRT